MKRAQNFIITCCIFLVFLAFSVYSQEPEVLICIESPQSHQWRQIDTLPLKICFRTDGYILATVSSETRHALDRIGIHYNVVDSNPWSESYYLVTHPEKLPVAGLITTGTIIHSSDGDAIVKITDEAAIDLVKNGVKISRIFNENLPKLAGETRYPISMRASSNLDGLIQELIAQISDSSFRAILQRMQDFNSRHTFSDSIVPARNWIKQKFLEYGYTEVQVDPFQYQGTIQENIYVILPGTQKTDRLIIIGGHYDSIVFDGNDATRIAPGVDDNATGSGGAMEIARVLADVDLETTVLFIAFATEEQGLIGSRHFAQNAYESDLNIDIVLNMDMIANVSDNIPDLNVLTNNQSRGFAELVAQMTRQYTNLIPVVAASGGGSDHLPFQQYGYPALFIQEGDFSPHWHRITDVIDNVDIGYGTQVLKSMVATIVTIANSPAAPADVTAIESGDGTTQLITWIPNQEPDVAGYKIYYGKSSGIYGSVHIAATSLDTLTGLVENEKVYCAISAYDLDGNESSLSAEITFTPTALPATPGGFVTTSKPDVIEMTWNRNNFELDFTDYIITRHGIGSEIKQFVVNPPATTYSDDTVEPRVLYQYSIQARDRDDNKSAPSIPARGRLVTHDQGILIVDGTKDGTGQSLRPTDEEVDGFYNTILQSFNTTGEWDLADSAQQQLAISDADMAIYSTVIWHSDITSASRKLSADSLALKKYLQNGGNLLLVGWSLLDNFSSQTEPPFKSYDPGEFVYNYLKIFTARTAGGADRDFIGADAVAAGYPSMTVDNIKVPVFGNNLFAMEVIEWLVGGDDTEILYTYRSSQNPPSEFHGKPIAFRYSNEAYQVIVIDFPIYFMPETGARELIIQALTALGEQQTKVSDRSNLLTSTPQNFELKQNYPNPLRLTNSELTSKSNVGTTTIRYFLPAESQVTIQVYNLLGQVVKKLVDDKKPAGEYLVKWDGLAEMDGPVPAGIYFYKMQAGNFNQVMKLLVIH